VYKNRNDVVSITPNILYFPPPLNRKITVRIQLKNITDNFAIFKFKTTAPKRYLVKPKDGIISPLETEIIEILLIESLDEVPKESKDKLLVETIRVSSGLLDKSNTNIPELFSKLESSKKQVVNNLLGCVFQQPGDDIIITQYSDSSIILEEKKKN